MTNKIKDIIRRGMSLILALIMMVPTGVYAQSYTVNNWDDYKLKLRTDIMNQEENITLNLTSSEIFTTEYYARLKIETIYNEVLKSIPKHIGEMNVKNRTSTPYLESSTNAQLKSVIYKIEYKNSAEELAKIKELLSPTFLEIKNKVTDYEKIKAAYDFVVNTLNDSENQITNLLNIHDDNSYAILFAMMMHDLGYENDIATSRTDNNVKWNIVKIQGLWYHVDGKNGELLISMDESNWIIEDHNDKLFDSNDYNGNPPTIPQLKYEITLLNDEVDNTKSEINKISIDVTSLDLIAQSILQLEPLKQRVENYIERINILDNEVNKSVNIKLEPDLENLKTKVKDLSELTKNKDISIKNLESAVKAVENTESKRTEENYNLANSLVINLLSGTAKQELSARLQVIRDELDAKEKTDDAERSLLSITNIEDDSKVNLAIEEAGNSSKAAADLVNKLDDSNTVKNQLISVLNRVNTVIIAKDRLDDADKNITKENIDLAKTAVSKINTKYSNIKKNLNLRIIELELSLKQIVADEILKIAISAVDKAKASVGNISETDILRDVIANSEGLVKLAEIEVKKIKDTSNKTIQQNRIKDIKLIITAIKAVDKAEVTMPYRESYISAAKTSILNINKEDKAFNSIAITITSLNARLIKLEESIKNSELEDIRKMEELIALATNEVKAAEDSLKDSSSITTDNIFHVEKAKDVIATLPKGTIKSGLLNTIEDLENAIKAKGAVELVVWKNENGVIIEKDIIVAEKAISIVQNHSYIPELNERLKNLRNILEERIANDLYNKAKEAVEKAETSAKLTSASLSKDITLAKSAIEGITSKDKYIDEINFLIARTNALSSYVNTINVLIAAEKNMNTNSQLAAENALRDYKVFVEKVHVNDRALYDGLTIGISDRIDVIKNYLKNELEILTTAINLVELAESNMTEKINPSNKEIVDAQTAVNKVVNKTNNAELQKRLNDIKTAINAKTAVEMAEAYTDSNSVSTADKAIIALVKTGSYLDIVRNLNSRLGILKNKLSIKKLVEDATKLVQKAIESRKITDITNASVAVKTLDGLENDAYRNLTNILEELKASLGNEAVEEAATLKIANEELTKAINEVNGVNIDIGKIIDPINQKDDIQAAYERVRIAKNNIIMANAAVKKLTDQKGLLEQISNANKEIDLAEDNIDVKEAIRMVTIASSSVINAKDEQQKSLAKLDISAARRAIDLIGHVSNKALKVTITNTINSIEEKLTSVNDQKLIDEAVEAVNIAASKVTSAVVEEKIMDLGTQEEIDKSIFAAQLAIGWISDNSMSQKNTLTKYLNEIIATFEAEKEGIKNEERIINAEKAVVEAESKKGTEELGSYIRAARLKISMIRVNGLDAETAKLKINELTTRLDILEGKTSGTPGNGNTPGGGNNKPGSGNNSGGSKIPLDALPDSKRIVGVADPNWGDTKKLKNSFTTIGISVQDMNAYKVLENKLKISELSNLLNTLNNPKSALIVRGKNILTDSAPYLKDKQNNNILLPVKILGDEFGFSVSLFNNPVLGGNKKLSLNGIVNGEIKSVLLEIGSEFGQVNGTYLKLSSKPLIQDGRTYIPLDFLVEHLGINFSYFNDKGNVQLILN